MWNYAALSHAAKLNNGPENYIRILQQNGYDHGLADGVGQCLEISLLISGATLACAAIVNFIVRKKLEESDNEAVEAKAELMKGLDKPESNAPSESDNESPETEAQNA